MRAGAGFAKFGRMWYGKSAMKTRILSLFAAAILLFSLLTGCRGTEPEAETSPEVDVTVDPHEGMIEVTDGAGGTMWVDEAEALTPFPLDRYSFSVTDGVVSYGKEGCTLHRGIDVSEYQHEIDWKAVADAGIEFAMIRIGWRGYSGGSIRADERYRENIEGARAAGLKVGAYFFSQAVSVMEAAEEAVFTAQLLDGIELDLPVFFDWEIIGTEPARTDDVDAGMVTACCLEYCRLLESEGIDSGVYSYIPVVYTKYFLNSLQGLTVWMGDPGNFPEFYYDHSIWQYSFTGTVPGIEGDVDLNVMYEITAPAETVDASSVQLVNMSEAEAEPNG